MLRSTVLAFCFSTLLLGVDYRYFRIPREVLSPSIARQMGFIEDHFHNENYVVGYLPTTADLSAFQKDRARLTELDPVAWAHTLYDVATLAPIESPRVSEENYEQFHTYETLTAELKTLAQRYPNLVTLESAGKSVQGRDLWYLRITNHAVQIPNKPKLLYISSMHGDEVTGKEMLVYLVRDLLTRHRDDSRVQALVDNAELFIMPSMNPDGTKMQQRFNAKGVDLNRDFPLMDEDPLGGDRAPETRAIQELHRKNGFTLALNFHGGSLVVNIPWDSVQNTQDHLFGDSSLIQSLAHAYADSNMPMHAMNNGSFDHGVTFGYEWYPVDGGMQDWACSSQQSTHATVEISETKWPSAAQLPSFWRDNQTALTQFLESGIFGIHLKVTNAAGELLRTTVGLSSSNRTLSFNGYVHRATLGGEQTVTIESEGYQQKVVDLNPESFKGQYVNVVLEKNKGQ